MSEPREFWVDPDADYSLGMNGVFEDCPSDRPSVHVIEKSAYDKLAAELADAAFKRTELENKLKDASLTESCLCRSLAAAREVNSEAFDELLRMRQQLQAERERADKLHEAELDRTYERNVAIQERDQARAQVTEYIDLAAKHSRECAQARAEVVAQLALIDGQAQEIERLKACACVLCQEERDRYAEALEKIVQLEGGEYCCDYEGLGRECEAWQLAREAIKK